jgi:hypothetical protein
MLRREVFLIQQPILKYLGNRRVEAHIRGKVQKTETDIPFGSFRSCWSPGVKESHRWKVFVDLL